MVADFGPFYEACRNKMQVTINYTKKDGAIVDHTGGIYEIRGDRTWLWDTTTNDSIRQFIMGNINSFQVLDIPFIPPHVWPIKIDGEVIL